VPAKWGDDLEFPLPFGRTLTAAEEHIHGLDEGTGASLKFTVLNPKGHVWLMVAGGGASVIYAGAMGQQLV
jgi:ATP citrate (pro-S)-lyase